MAEQSGSLRERMNDDLKQAMRARDTQTRDALRYALAAVKNQEIERRGPLSAEDELAVLRRLTKQLTEAVEQARAGGRESLAEQESAQLRIIERYLPAAMNEDEVRALVDSVVSELGATSPKDLGRVMPVLIARAAGRADNRQLSTLARDRLTAS